MARRSKRCQIPAKGDEVTAELQGQAAPCLYEMYRERLAALGTPQPASEPLPQFVAEDGFIHPLCLADGIPLKACNRGNRHIPVLAEPDGSYSAWLPNDESDRYWIVGTLSDGPEVAVTARGSGSKHCGALSMRDDETACPDGGADLCAIAGCCSLLLTECRSFSAASPAAHL